MKKTYIDECLERSEKEGFDCNLAEQVPELARRLKMACDYLRNISESNRTGFQVADELEAPPEEPDACDIAREKILRDYYKPFFKQVSDEQEEK